MTAADRDLWVAQGLLVHFVRADPPVAAHHLANTLRYMADLVERDLVDRQVHWDTLRLERVEPATIGGLAAFDPADLLRITVEVAQVTPAEPSLPTMPSR